MHQFTDGQRLIRQEFCFVSAHDARGDSSRHVRMKPVAASYIGESCASLTCRQTECRHRQLGQLGTGNRLLRLEQISTVSFEYVLFCQRFHCSLIRPGFVYIGKVGRCPGRLNRYQNRRTNCSGGKQSGDCMRSFSFHVVTLLPFQRILVPPQDREQI